MRVRPLIVVLCVLLVAAVAWWLVVRAADVTPVPDAGASLTPSVVPGIPPDAFEMTVESVHDGDTLRARVAVPNGVVTDLESTRVRLLGVDTPETSPELECWGAEATVHLTELLPPGATLWAAPDREVLDQYGRHLLYVWTADGVFVNAALIAAGDAEVMIFAPNDLHEGLFRTLEAEASTQDVGMWGTCR